MTEFTSPESELLEAERALTVALEAHDRAVHELAVATEHENNTAFSVIKMQKRLDAARRALRTSYSEQWARA